MSSQNHAVLWRVNKFPKSQSAMAGKTVPKITHSKRTILSQSTVFWQMLGQIPILNIFQKQTQKYGPGKHNTTITSAVVYLLLKILLRVGVDYIDLLNCLNSQCIIGHRYKAICKRNRILMFGLRTLDYKLP
jgi:hypothetical protein